MATYQSKMTPEFEASLRKSNADKADADLLKAYKEGFEDGKAEGWRSALASVVEEFDRMDSERVPCIDCGKPVTPEEVDRLGGEKCPAGNGRVGHRMLREDYNRLEVLKRGES